MRLRSGDDASWRAALADALPGSFAGKPSFTLYSAVAEASAWADRALLSAWDRPDNAGSIAADVEAGLSVCGPVLRGLFQPVATALVQALQQVAASRKADRRSSLASLTGVARRAEALMHSPSLRVAVWEDVTAQASGADPDLAAIDDHIALLNAVLMGPASTPVSGSVDSPTCWLPPRHFWSSNQMRCRWT